MSWLLSLESCGIVLLVNNVNASTFLSMGRMCSASHYNIFIDSLRYGALLWVHTTPKKFP